MFVVKPSHDELVLDCLEDFRPMLTRIAWRTGTPLDDVMQQASLIILEALPKMPMHMEKPRAYLNVLVRGRIYGYIHSLTPPTNIVSLDQPLGEDSTQTLADLLPAPPISLSERREQKRITVLYKAIHLLPRIEQEYLRRRYRLHGLQIWSHQPGNPYRTDYSIQRSALRQLRRNQKLALALKGR